MKAERLGGWKAWMPGDGIRRRWEDGKV